jgi:hypothetical protein
VSEPLFLTVSTVEAIHDLQIRRYAGTGGLRDRGALEAAVFQPQNVFFYAAGDLYEIAAASRSMSPKLRLFWMGTSGLPSEQLSASSKRMEFQREQLRTRLRMP